MDQAKNNVDLLNLMRGKAPKGNGLRIAVISTADPDPITISFEGTPLALDAEIFEIPVSLYPLKPGDRLLSYLMLGEGISQRWALLAKLNGGPIYLATMAGPTSLTIDGIAKTYTSQDLIIPQFVVVAATASSGYLAAGDIRPLQAGDRVGVAATWDGGKIKYTITGRY